jgi:hypothetical protein
VTDHFTTDLARVQGRRRARAPMLLGSLLAPVGLLLILLAWLGSAHTPVLQEQISYLISGGLIGLSLVVLGGFLYFGHWQTQQLRVTQAQTGQVVDALRSLQSSVDRLASSFEVRPALVATPGGTISHLPTCSVVRGRSDLHTANGELHPCKICQSA